MRCDFFSQIANAIRCDAIYFSQIATAIGCDAIFFSKSPTRLDAICHKNRPCDCDLCDYLRLEIAINRKNRNNYLLIKKNRYCNQKIAIIKKLLM